MLKSYISDETVNICNDLLKGFFKMNSICDNLVYNLDNLGLHNCANIFHESYAHTWPVIADQLSTRMTKLNARAVRRSFPGDEMTYTTISEIFNVAKTSTEKIRADLLHAMDVLDYDISNKEIILCMEDISIEILDLLFQVNIWTQYAEYYERKDKVMQFDQNFDKFKSPLVETSVGATGDDD